jgi:hypothetical protein
MSPSNELSFDNLGKWTQSGLNLIDRTTRFLPVRLAIDGVIGKATRAALKAFQERAPSLLPDATTLPHSGSLDATTLWALETLTDSKNPAGRTATPPVETTATDASAKKDAPSQAAPSGDTSVDVEGSVKKGLSEAAGPRPDKVEKAYAELKAWTNEQYGKGDDKNTKRALASLEKEYAKKVAQATKKGATPPERAPWFAANFFKQYWMLHCDKFANELSQRIYGEGFPTLAGLRAQTDGAAEAQGKDGGPIEVAGRDVRKDFRGKTMTQLANELAEANVEAGAGVHVKSRFEVDRPYDPAVKDEFHHWFVYDGGKTFSDSFGAKQSGETCDKFLKNWVTGDFHQAGRPGEPFDFTPLHTPPYATQASLEEAASLGKERDDALASGDKKAVAAAEKRLRDGKLPKPDPTFQPKVTAVYRPQMAKKNRAASSKKGS